jgi:hypothetical protein
LLKASAGADPKLVKAISTLAERALEDVGRQGIQVNAGLTQRLADEIDV